MRIEVNDVVHESRYVATIDGEFAGLVDYRRGDGHLELPRTVVDPAFEGRGVGSAMVRVALDAARAAGESVSTTCWFVAGFIDRHSEYAALLAADPGRR